MGRLLVALSPFWIAGLACSRDFGSADVAVEFVEASYIHCQDYVQGMLGRCVPESFAVTLKC
jgi:hypothetical protein